MASAPLTQGGLNQDAEPWTPPAATQSPSLNATPEIHPPDCSQSLQQVFLPQHPQPCHAPFFLPHHLYRNPNFVLQPMVRPSFFPPQPVAMQCLPFIETYKVGHHQAEMAQAQNVIPENRGGTLRRSRNMGYGQRSAPKRNGFVPARPRNGSPKLAWRPKTGNDNAGGNDNTVFYGAQSDQSSKKQRENPIPLQSGGGKTTLMVRNIPNKYTRKMLKNFLMKHCKLENGKKGKEEVQYSAFDFVYLPIDFRTNGNKGYAFVNFTNPEAAWKFSLSKRNQIWDCFNSTKIREICCAKVQGKEALMKHFEGMRFPLEEYQPLCFEPSRDGSTGQMVKEIPIGVCTNRRGLMS